MNAPAYALEDEHIESSSPEKAMWCAALALLASDARMYHRKGSDALTAVPGTGKRALADLLECGPMTRRFCDYADLNPEWISRGFAESLHKAGKKTA